MNSHHLNLLLNIAIFFSFFHLYNHNTEKNQIKRSKEKKYLHNYQDKDGNKLTS